MKVDTASAIMSLTAERDALRAQIQLANVDAANREAEANDLRAQLDRSEWKASQYAERIEMLDGDRMRLINDTIAASRRKDAERDAQLAAAHQAVGLLTTLAPSVVMDPDDLLGMAQKIVESVQRVPEDAELDALGKRANRYLDEMAGDDLEWIEAVRVVTTQRDAITALRRQLAERSATTGDVIDAERYRYLRNDCAESSLGVYEWRGEMGRQVKSWLALHELDDAIDAAMRGDRDVD